jgi:hypothetical protein
MVPAVWLRSCVDGSTQTPTEGTTNMDDLMAKAQETADKLRGGITALTGTPGVAQLMTRNDLTPAADGLLEWTQNLVAELQAESSSMSNQRRLACSWRRWLISTSRCQWCGSASSLRTEREQAGRRLGIADAWTAAAAIC